VNPPRAAGASNRVFRSAIDEDEYDEKAAASEAGTLSEIPKQRERDHAATGESDGEIGRPAIRVNPDEERREGSSLRFRNPVLQPRGRYEEYQ